MRIKEFLAREIRIKRGWLVVILILVLLAEICNGTAYIIERGKAEMRRDVVEYYQDTYRFDKSNSKDILSIDGGLNWYSYQKDSKGGIRIIEAVK